MGADPAYRVPIRIITEMAWHNLFARNMFLQESDPANLAQHVPHFTVIDAPGFNANPEVDGTNSEVCIAGRRPTPRVADAPVSERGDEPQDVQCARDTSE